MLQEKSDDFIASMAEPLRDDERAKLEGKMDEVFLLFPLFLLAQLHEVRVTVFRQLIRMHSYRHIRLAATVPLHLIHY
jgi:hypothetical protein